ncbi:DUF3540 domain-containing protein [Niveibacterium sp. SC-1]|uniref:DUF3540 domain-containing protein n=1 Tax=Niveibacterium sp. SC-1 TaxID=3135646 RepID=UPI00311F1ECA
MIETLQRHADAATSATSAGQCAATVMADLGEGEFLVEAGGLPVRCRRAASCLLAPELNDLVLLVRLEGARHYVLSVLERHAPARIARIELGDKASLSAGELVCEADQFALTSTQAKLRIDELGYVGKEWQGVVGAVRHTGRWLHCVVDRLMQVARLSSRQVQEKDEVHAGQIEYIAEDCARLDARVSMLTARKLIKVDAEQVHVG